MNQVPLNLEDGALFGPDSGFRQTCNAENRCFQRLNANQDDSCAHLVEPAQKVIATCCLRSVFSGRGMMCLPRRAFEEAKSSTSIEMGVKHLELCYPARNQPIAAEPQFSESPEEDQPMSESAAAPSQRTHEDKLSQLAEVAVKVGLGLQAGQELLMTASLDALPLARRITEQAYRAGASLVTTLYTDDEAALMRYHFAPEESFDRAANWLYDGMGAAFKSGAARLAIAGGNPALLSNEDPTKVSRANRAVSQAYRPALELITRHAINWTIVASATPAWASAVFPGDAAEVALARLWDAIFETSRINGDDPVAAWKTHDAGLHQRAARLNEKRYSALQYRGPGTDFRLGLADDHQWLGGGTTAGNGLYCIPNMPTEEVFTTPHKDRADGTVTATKPLSHQGTMIEGIQVRFEKGRIVEARASRGQEVLQKLIDTDQGACRLGEVALVPHSSPIAASGMLFFNTLFDENAASHIALGQSYSSCLKDGDKLTPEELAAKGANDSLIHVDWMIGSGMLDIDGITAAGAQEPLMRQGEWV
jgi:aminopeptidase